MYYIRTNILRENESVVEVGPFASYEEVAEFLKSKHYKEMYRGYFVNIRDRNLNTEVMPLTPPEKFSPFAQT